MGECRPSAAARYAGPPAAGANPVGVLADFTDLVADDLDTGFNCRVDQCAVQHRPTNAAPVAALELRVDVLVAVPIADPTDRLAERIH